MEVRKDKRTVLERLRQQLWIGGQERDLLVLGFTKRITSKIRVCNDDGSDYFEYL